MISSISIHADVDQHTNERGNYRDYYRRRPDHLNRVSLLCEHWFRRKVCLDVGCNKGLLCVELAARFAPNSILGIDSDPLLIDHAKSLHKRLTYEAIHKEPQDHDVDDNAKLSKHLKADTCASRNLQFMPRSLNKTTEPKPRSKASEASPLVEGQAFPGNVCFVRKDIFDLSSPSSRWSGGRYDTITCFSVTKWVHLNGGDEMLLALFHKLFALVRSGGLVIVEYQPWKSYENNKAINEDIRRVFKSISIRPSQFEEVLLRDVGFQLERRLGPSESEAKGFDRPILALRKPYGPDAATTPIEHYAADKCPSEDSIHAKSSKDNSDTSGCTGADATVTTLSNSHRERHCISFGVELPLRKRQRL